MLQMKVALVIIAAALALVGIFSSKQKWLKWVAAVLVIIIAFGQIWVECESAQKEKRSRWNGVLTSPTRSKETIPVLLVGAGLGPDPPRMSPVPPSHELMTLADGAPVLLRMDRGEAKISMWIRDREHRLLASIRDNEWMVNQQRAFDRNFNDNALEVIDDKGKVLFQIQVQGHEVKFAALLDEYVLFAPLFGPNEGSLFVYPSSQHAGELMEDYLKKNKK